MFNPTKKNIALLIIPIFAVIAIIGVYFWKYPDNNNSNQMTIKNTINTNKNMQFIKEGYIKISGGDEVYTESKIIFKPGSQVNIELKNQAKYGYFYDKNEQLKDFNSFISAGQMDKFLKDIGDIIPKLKKTDVKSLENITADIQLASVSNTFKSDKYDLDPLLSIIENFVINSSKIKISASINNKTSKFIGSTSDFKIELNNLHGLYGGRNILIYGDGRAFIQSAEIKNNSLTEKRYTMILNKSEIQKIINDFINNDFCALKSDMPKSILPDTSVFSISLTGLKADKYEVITTQQSNLLPNEYIKSDRKKIDSVYKILLDAEKFIQKNGKQVFSGDYKDGGWDSFIK